MSEKEIDELSGTETTGHEWDGIKELNTPLPRWWLWTFYACIIWSIGYCIYYPAIPLLDGNTEGVGGYSSRAEVAAELAAAEDARSGQLQEIAATDVGAIKDNDDLYRFAVAGGSSAFKVHCSQCHGSGAQGSPGYPNLNDDVWLWGGSVEAIHQTITHGIRYEEDDDSRFSEMPAFGRDEILDAATIRNAAHYVRSLAGLEHDADRASEGAVAYEEQCAACHGDAGQGDPEQGAPRLADALWLYGEEVDQIVAQIQNPKHGVMPAWGARLGDVTVKQLAVYVHSLGGGE